jgi:hypothetical protein
MQNNMTMTNKVYAIDENGHKLEIYLEPDYSNNSITQYTINSDTGATYQGIEEYGSTIVNLEQKVKQYVDQFKNNFAQLN